MPIVMQINGQRGPDQNPYLRIASRAKMNEIAELLSGVDVQNAPFKAIKEWHEHFMMLLNTTEDVEKIIVDSSPQLIKALEGWQNAKQAAKRTDDSRKLLLSLMNWFKSHQIEIPENLGVFLNEMVEITPQDLLDEDQRMQEILKKQALFKGKRAQRGALKFQVAQPPNIHTMKEILEGVAAENNGYHQRVDAVEAAMNAKREAIRRETEAAEAAIKEMEKSLVDLQAGGLRNRVLAQELERNPMNAQGAGAADHLAEHALRRKLRGELAILRNLIEEASLPDDMTKDIDLWGTQFGIALSEKLDEHEVHREFVKLLQELLTAPHFFVLTLEVLLKQPLPAAPYDDEAFLGNDGVTYGKKAYAVWQDLVPVELKSLSPMSPESEQPFYMQPHKIVRHMVKWLKENEALQTSEIIEDNYRKLAEREEAKAAQENEARIQRVLAQSQERQRQRDQAIQDKREELAAHMAQHVLPSVTAPIAQVRNAYREGARTVNETLRQMENANRESARELKESLNQKRAKVSKVARPVLQSLKIRIVAVDLTSIHSDQFTNATKRAIALKKSREQEKADFEKGNVHLAKKLDKISQESSAVDKDKVRLQHLTHETRKAFKKQETKGALGFILTKALVAGCGLATFGLGSVVGEGLAILPIKSGASAVLAVPF